MQASSLPCAGPTSIHTASAVRRAMEQHAEAGSSWLGYCRGLINSHLQNSENYKIPGILAAIRCKLPVFHVLGLQAST